MKKNNTILSYSQRLILLLAMLFAVSGVAVAQTGTSWTAPTQNPPEGNVPAPINVGPYLQTKQGILQLGASRTRFLGHEGKNAQGQTTASGNNWLMFGGSTEGVHNVLGVQMNIEDVPVLLRFNINSIFHQDLALRRSTLIFNSNTAPVATIMSSASADAPAGSGRFNLHANARGNNLLSGSEGASRIRMHVDSMGFFLAPANLSLTAAWSEIMRISSNEVRIFRNLRVDGGTNIGGDLTVEGDTNFDGDVYFNERICTGPDSCIDITNIGDGSGSRWSASGNNIFREQGNVGIGTSNPGARLHLRVPINNDGSNIGGTNQGLRITRGDSNENVAVITQQGGAAIPGASGIVQLYEGSNEMIRLAARSGTNSYILGNLGVNVASPQARLHVGGNIRSAGDICTDLNGGVCLSTISGGDGGSINPNDVSKWQTYSQAFSDGTSVSFLSPKSNISVVSVPNILRLNNSALLEQSGSTKVLTVNNSGNVGYRNISDVGGGGGDSLWTLVSQDPSIVPSRIYTSVAPGDRHVGIGTDSPTASLDVRGTSRLAGTTRVVGPSFTVANTADDDLLRVSSAQGAGWLRISGTGQNQWNYSGVVLSSNNITNNWALLHRKEAGHENYFALEYTSDGSSWTRALSVAPNRGLIVGDPTSSARTNITNGGLLVSGSTGNPAWIRIQGYPGPANYSGLTFDAHDQDNFWSFAYRRADLTRPNNPSALTLGYGKVGEFNQRLIMRPNDYNIIVGGLRVDGFSNTRNWSGVPYDWNADGQVLANDVVFARNCVINSGGTNCPGVATAGGLMSGLDVLATRRALVGLTPAQVPISVLASDAIVSYSDILSLGDVCSIDNSGTTRCLSHLSGEGGGSTPGGSSLPPGTVNDQTLRWNGSAWVPNNALISDGASVTMGGSRTFFPGSDGGSNAGFHWFMFRGQGELIGNAIGVGRMAGGTGNAHSDVVLMVPTQGENSAQQGNMIRLNRSGVYVGPNVPLANAGPLATLDVRGTIRITGGNPGAGKVLTSDASGRGSWQEPGATMTSYMRSSNNNSGNVISHQGVTYNNGITGGYGSIDMQCDNPQNDILMSGAYVYENYGLIDARPFSYPVSRTRWRCVQPTVSTPLTTISCRITCLAP